MKVAAFRHTHMLHTALMRAANSVVLLQAHTCVHANTTWEVCEEAKCQGK